MNDLNRNAQTPADEDPEIHRLLATLPAHSPGPVFENRVLARVWRPLPAQLKHWLERWHDFVRSGRIYGVAGVAALGGLLTTTVAVGAVVQFWSEIRFGVGWFFRVGLPYAWARLLEDIEPFVSTVNATLNALFPSQAALLGAAAGSLLLLAGCAWGLHRTMNPRGAARLSR